MTLLGTIARKDGCICLQLASAPTCFYPLGGSSGIAAEFRETFNDAAPHDIGRELHRVNGILYLGTKGSK